MAARHRITGVDASPKAPAMALATIPLPNLRQVALALVNPGWDLSIFCKAGCITDTSGHTILNRGYRLCFGAQKALSVSERGLAIYGIMGEGHPHCVG
jgi:hypothetical protein